jgi:hypothetical protein
LKCCQCGYNIPDDKYAITETNEPICVVCVGDHFAYLTPNDVDSMSDIAYDNLWNFISDLRIPERTRYTIFHKVLESKRFADNCRKDGLDIKYHDDNDTIEVTGIR